MKEQKERVGDNRELGWREGKKGGKKKAETKRNANSTKIQIKKNMQRDREGEIAQGRERDTGGKEGEREWVRTESWDGERKKGGGGGGKEETKRNANSTQILTFKTEITDSVRKQFF